MLFLIEEGERQPVNDVTKEAKELALLVHTVSCFTGSLPDLHVPQTKNAEQKRIKRDQDIEYSAEHVTPLGRVLGLLTPHRAQALSGRTGSTARHTSPCPS
jgi:hypothetical protein